MTALSRHRAERETSGARVCDPQQRHLQPPRQSLGNRHSVVEPKPRSGASGERRHISFLNRSYSPIRVTYPQARKSYCQAEVRLVNRKSHAPSVFHLCFICVHLWLKMPSHLLTRATHCKPINKTQKRTKTQKVTCFLKSRSLIASSYRSAGYHRFYHNYPQISLDYPSNYPRKLNNYPDYPNYPFFYVWPSRFEPTGISTLHPKRTFAEVSKCIS